jgi:anti-repressor protein
VAKSPAAKAHQYYLFLKKFKDNNPLLEEESMMMIETKKTKKTKKMVEVIDGRVNGRELHDYLESKQQFADWIKNRIESYDFQEGRDFHKFTKNPPAAGGRPTIEYSLTLSMAKKLCMVENNEQGNIAREYFIERERMSYEATKIPSLLEQAMATSLPKLGAMSDLPGRRPFDSIISTTAGGNYFSTRLFPPAPINRLYATISPLNSNKSLSQICWKKVRYSCAWVHQNKTRGID